MYDFSLIPVVTEKSTLESTEGKYHFVVPAGVTKIQVKQLAEKMYGKKVDKVTVMNTVAKKRTVGRGRVITKRKAKRKVIISFKNKETIDINKIK